MPPSKRKMKTERVREKREEERKGEDEEEEEEKKRERIFPDHREKLLLFKPE